MSTQSRGFLANTDIESLKEKAARPPYDALWERLRRRTTAAVRSALESDFSSGHYGSLGNHSHTPMLPEAALLYRLSGEDAMLHYVRRCIRHVDQHARREIQTGGKTKVVHSHRELAVATDMVRSSLSDADREILTDFMREVAIDHRPGPDAYRYHGGGGNISYCRNISAAVCALLWGEDCGHPRRHNVVDEGIAHTRCYLKHGCDASGFSYEGTGYGLEVLRLVFNFVELLHLSGYASLYETEPRLRKVPDAALQALFPDRRFLINDGDVGLQGPAALPQLLLAYRAYGDPLHLGFWEEFQGPDHPLRPFGDGEPWLRKAKAHGLDEAGPPDAENLDSPVPDPAHAMFTALLYWDADAPRTPISAADRPTCTCAKGTGTATFRTSWGRRAVYLSVLGAGRSHGSLTHAHGDAGHISLWAYGDYLAVDTGRYNVDEDQHNVMLVEGKPRLSRRGSWGQEWIGGCLRDFQHRPPVACVRSEADRLKECIWADRHALFVTTGPDEAYIVLLDNFNRDHSPHTYLWQLHANPAYRYEITGDRTATLHGDQARLDITFSIPSPDTYPDRPHELHLRQDVQDWQWPYGVGNTKEEHRGTGLLNTCLERPRLLAELSGPNAHLLTVLSPRRRNDPPLAVRERNTKALFRLEIECPHFTDTLLAAPDHRCIQTDTVQALTDIALLRRDRRGRILATWTRDGSRPDLVR